MPVSQRVRRAGARLKRALVRQPAPSPAPAAAPVFDDPMPRLALTPELWVDPFPHYEEMRARGPIYESVNNLIVITGYDEVNAALKEEAFITDPMYVGEAESGLGPDSIVKSNPPRHTEMRRQMVKWFTPRKIAQLHDVVVEQCDDLLDPLMKQPQFDVVQDFALPLAIRVIAHILGVPSEYHPRFKELGDAAAKMLDPFLGPEESAAGYAASEEILQYFKTLYDERRKVPGDDFMSGLLNPGPSDAPLTDSELLANAQFILLAGYETTVGMIGSGTNILIERPDYWKAMQGDDDLVANVVEETLRVESPVQMTPRIARENVSWNGFDIPEGARVMSVLAAANRDPRMFPDPARFDPWRENANRHVAFVVGPHHCLGSSLARLEGAVAFRSLLTRLPELHRAGEPKRRPNFIARGLTNLPVAVPSR